MFDVTSMPGIYSEVYIHDYHFSQLRSVYPAQLRYYIINKLLTIMHDFKRNSLLNKIHLTITFKYQGLSISANCGDKDAGLGTNTGS
jgi:hypothetical protein